MKRILITGATGYIGQYLIDELLRSGHVVIASSAHAEKAAQAAWYDQVRYIPFDLSAFETAENYFRFFEEPDIMIHLAWEGLPNYKDSFHIRENYPRHAAFLENLLRNGLRDLTVTGTCLEYGMQEGELQEGLPALPTTAYAIAKDMLRRRIQELQAERSFVFRWVRLFFMYGRGQASKSLFSQLNKAIEDGAPAFNMSGGEQVRDYLPVEQVAVYLAKIALQAKVTGIINCCSGHPVTVRELVEDYLRRKHKVITLNPGYYPYPDYEPMKFWGDTSKLRMITAGQADR
ncbi:MAG TPA: NAD(P)-dependent oxidoreductase [Puia sp.]|nr:NAD(P)-dependent oxidoreductase [Puia sp.]